MLLTFLLMAKLNGIRIVGGGESGAMRPIPLLPNQLVNKVISMPHVRQEIYSTLSFPHYAQKLWVTSQKDKAIHESQEEGGNGCFPPIATLLNKPLKALSFRFAIWRRKIYLQ